MHVWKRLKPIPGFERQSNCIFSCKDFVAAVGFKEIFSAQKEKRNFLLLFSYAYAFISLFLVSVMHFVGVFLQEKPQRHDYVQPGVDI